MPALSMRRFKAGTSDFDGSHPCRGASLFAISVLSAARVFLAASPLDMLRTAKMILLIFRPCN